MSPQFVDFDGDGHLDIVAGIFDGSPKLARGNGKHWAQPAWILDQDGQRVVMNAFWNFDAKKWDDTDRCDPDGGMRTSGHLTSAIAFDIDGDGDLDLLLGDHRGGQVMLRRNLGTRTQPRFAAKNEWVLFDGEPLLVPGTVTTLRAVDWDGDGALDLLIGSMGDAYQGKTGGGVFVCRNLGGDGDRRFAAPVTLVAPERELGTGPSRPFAGLYMDAADHDGDSDLDLIVGAYTMWDPPAPALDAEQRSELAALREREQALSKRFAQLNAEMLKATEGLDPEAAKAKRAELLGTRERTDLNEERADVAKRIRALEPGRQRDSFVWLFENLAQPPGAKPDGSR
jgi:hypothetical protein